MGKILRHTLKVTREKAGRDPNPTYALIDSQSVKTAYASEQINYDKGKKGSKAGIFPAIAAYRKYPTIQRFSRDEGYRKSFKNNVKNILGLYVDISPKIKAEGFQVMPKRWVVESEQFTPP